VLRSQWIQTETNNHTVVEDSASLEVYIPFIQKVKMKIHALSLHLLKPLLANFDILLTVHLILVINLFNAQNLVL